MPIGRCKVNLPFLYKDFTRADRKANIFNLECEEKGDCARTKKDNLLKRFFFKKKTLFVF